MNLTRAKIAGWLFAAAGAVILFSALVSYFHTSSYVRKSAKAEGTIIRFAQGYPATALYPIYWFRKPDGEGQQVYTDSVGKHTTTHKRGDKVTLIYQADHPADAIPYTFWNVWSRPMKLLGIGLGCLLFGGFVLFAERG